MLGNSRAGTNVLIDQYRLAGHYGHFRAGNPQITPAGYFRLGSNAVCYGRLSAGFVQKDASRNLYDALDDVVVEGSETVLPFDLNEIVDNLRFERYAQHQAHGGNSLRSTLPRKIYYTFRPLMPVFFRKHLQRIYLRGWEKIPFPAWPVDRTVENIFEELLILSLQSQSVQKIPFVWFWPDGCTACSIVTHDIETEAGRAASLQLADLDASFGIKSAFQVVPEKRYRVSSAFLDSIRTRGCEVNLHGLNHDGQLFRDRTEFLRQVEQINRYAREYGAAGFRSPVLYRNIEWYSDLDFSYDMSVPNSAHLEPQRGGCCTVMPYFIGNLVELPLTTTQDYTLFNVIGNHSIELWKQQIRMITEKHGLVSFNTHPDYLLSDKCRAVYEQLLDYLVRVCAEQRIWLALPGEVDRWWRQRSEMRIVSNEKGFQVSGPFSERAVVAYASLQDGRIVYEAPGREFRRMRSSA